MTTLKGQMYFHWNLLNDNMEWSIHMPAQKAGQGNLYTLEKGDFLTIYTDYKRDTILWSGNIEPCSNDSCPQFSENFNINSFIKFHLKENEHDIEGVDIGQSFIDMIHKKPALLETKRDTPYFK